MFTFSVGGSNETKQRPREAGAHKKLGVVMLFWSE